jgi:hypothetical protein
MLRLRRMAYFAGGSFGNFFPFPAPWIPMKPAAGRRPNPPAWTPALRFRRTPPSTVSSCPRSNHSATNRHQQRLIAQRLMPLGDRLMPVADRLMPLANRLVLVVQGLMPLGHQSMPLVDQLIVVGQRPMPLVERLMPVAHRLILVAHRLMPLGHRLILVARRLWQKSG